LKQTDRITELELEVQESENRASRVLTDKRDNIDTI